MIRGFISKAIVPGFKRFSPSFFRTLATTVKVPNLAESITEGEVKSIINVGDFVQLDGVLANIETGKLAVDIKATCAGKVIKLFAGVADNVKVGADFAIIDETQTGPAAGAAPPKAEKPAEAKAEAPKPAASSQPAAPTPAAAPAPKKEAPKKEAPKVVAPVLPKGARESRRVPMSKLRQTAAQRLKESQNVNAMLTTFNECDMLELSRMKKDLGEDFNKAHNIKLGFMSAFAKASVMSLQKYPALNACIDGKDMIYHDYIDVSVAVSAPRGLVVPIIRNCESMSLWELEKAIAELANKARDDKLTLEDMTGGTFTITNGGVFGSLLSTPIINMPQSAILGLHSIKNRPIVTPDNKIEAHPMMYLALSYDHRMVDGREAVLFLRNIKELIEDPRRMLLEI